MANMAIDTDVMRASANVFATNSTAFKDEADKINATLSDISAALEKVVKDFEAHNGNVAGFASEVSKATHDMEAVWESGAAVSFAESFTNFNTAMLNLSQMLQDISEDFADIKQKIQELVNNNVMKQVEAYASECSINSENLKAYADAQDENDANLARAYGQ